LAYRPFEGILLASDIDGTLLTRDGTMPQSNKTAIRRFTRLGGKFAVATGRAPASARRYALAAGANVPCILINGTLIYDFRTRRELWSRWLPDTAAAVFYEACANFPNVRTEAYCARGNYIGSADGKMPEGSAGDMRLLGAVRPDGLKQPAHKFVFWAPHDELLLLQKRLEEMPHEGIEYCYSCPVLLEALPCGADKGSALRELARISGADAGRLAAIGDYDNDLGLLRSARFSAAPGDGAEQALETAGYTACPCGEGAVADFIGYLERTLTQA
jgi:Cof subfamily protein (haloacid dehalogenase superfamily)